MTTATARKPRARKAKTTTPPVASHTLATCEQPAPFIANVTTSAKDIDLAAKLNRLATDDAATAGEKAAALAGYARITARLPVALGATFVAQFFAVAGGVADGFNRWQVPCADAAAQANSCRISVSKAGITFYGSPSCANDCGSCVGCAIGQFRQVIRDGQKGVCASLKAKGITPGGKFSYCGQWYRGWSRAIVAMLAPAMLANAATCAAIAKQYPQVLAPLPYLPAQDGALANEGARTADRHFGNEPQVALTA